MTPHFPGCSFKALATMADSEDDTPPGSYPISIVEVQAAAGGGAVVDMEEVTGHVWFRRDWQLESANPEYTPVSWDQFMEIIGEVR